MNFSVVGSRKFTFGANGTKPLVSNNIHKICRAWHGATLSQLEVFNMSKVVACIDAGSNRKQIQASKMVMTKIEIESYTYGA